VVERTFREDLFFRLNVVCITLPPLRQRRDEIPLLTEVFLQQYAAHYNKPRLAVSARTLQIFTEYDWPGNVRELENRAKRGVIRGGGGGVAQHPADPTAGRKGSVGPIAALDPHPRNREAPAPASTPAMSGAAPEAAPVPVCGSLKEIARNAAREA